MKNIRLEGTVFTTGACCMILEMVGARMLAPLVGTSITVWTAVIGIVLGAMAFGNYVGGKLSDRRNTEKTFASLLLLAGIGVALSLLCFLLSAEGISALIRNIYLTAIVLSVILLSLPASLLGMITPFAVRLAITDVESSGTTLGRIYAFSTIGSILGTFLGGFVLISFFSTISIILGVSFVLFCLSRIFGGKSRIFLMISFCLFFYLGLYTNERYIESPYTTIQIVDGTAEDKRPVRYLLTGNNSLQSGMYVDAPNELLFDYTKYYLVGLDFFPDAKNVLVIGGGAFSVPKKFLELGKKVTVVEIDPVLTQISKKFFALPASSLLTVINEDARTYINTANEQFDIVCVDVFTESVVPFHIITAEAAKKLSQLTKSVLILNVISAIEGDDGRLAQSIVATFSQVFADVQVYCVGKSSPSTIQNIILIASPTQKLPEIAKESDLLATRYEGDLNFSIAPLRDTFAPVELYTSRYAQRHYVGD